MAWMHGWTGLILGWLLLVICAAGTLSVFRPEIGRWMRPETVAVASPAAATQAAVGWLSRNATTAPAWYLSLPDGRSNTVLAVYRDGSEFVTRALDPVTGAPVPRETRGGEFFYRLHFELQLPYPWGRILASLAAAFMLVAIVTGVIAHKKIFKDFFTFRPGKGQRSWLDAHNALGVLSLPFHAMITFTGLLTLATTTMPWAIMSNYGSDAGKMYAEFVPEIERKPTGRAAPLAPIASMMRTAETRFGASGVGSIAVENPGDAAATVTMTANDADEITRISRQMTFDGSSGRVLSDWREAGRPVVATYNVLYGLHMVHFGHVLIRWLYFLGGAMLTGAVASGLVLWVVKRRERAPRSLANRAIERINVGMIGGMPIAFMAYFWANRLLPAGMEGRADIEVAAVLWVWIGALAMGLMWPPKAGWPLLLTIAALACAGPPFLSVWVPGASLFAAIGRGDGAFIGGDLVMLASAAGFWTAARHARRAAARPLPVRSRRNTPAPIAVPAE